MRGGVLPVTQLTGCLRTANEWSRPSQPPAATSVMESAYPHGLEESRAPNDA
jgi:hypothetical protein